ncbi:MAG: hypothetical protein ACR2IE_19250 [Candidatus Sumerlaeaceae bacterium]
MTEGRDNQHQTPSSAIGVVLRVILGLVLGIALLLLFMYGMFYLSAGRFSRERWEKVAANAEPLIQAIQQYERDKGRPPGLVEQLMPKYIVRIPGTGDRHHPDITYNYWPHTDDYGNSWTLYVSAGSFTNFDAFIYHPSGVYPPDDGGNWYERIGKWAYYHE